MSTGTTILIRIIATISFLLSIVLMAVCVWTIIGIQFHADPANSPVESLAVQASSPTTSTTTPPPPTTTPGFSEQQGELNSKTRVRAPDGNSKNERQKRRYKPEEQKAFPSFHSMPKDYKWIIMGCAIGSIAAGLVQLISSGAVGCTCSKKEPNVNIWLLFNFITFLILLITLLTPLTYDPHKDEHVKVGEFLPNAKSKMSNMFGGDESFPKMMTRDLNLYYIILGLNESFLLVVMIMGCVLKRCGCAKSDYAQIS